MHPPTRAELLAILEAGQLEERLDFARRMGNHRAHASLLRKAWLRTIGGDLPNADSDGRRPPLVPPPAWRGIPTTGALKTFALLIEFQDERHCNSAQAIGQALYGPPQPENPYDSWAAYYDRSSYHQLDLYDGVTLGWYQTAYPRRAVAPSDAGREALIKEALSYFHAQGHDFSQYDNDDDGVVDFFQVLWSGADTGWGTFWWPYEAEFKDESFSLDGVGFWHYAWMWDSRPQGAPFDPPTAIHETGHALGLPDYYDGDLAKGPRGGIGGLDPMDSTRFDHNCFSKWLLDWLTPTTIRRGAATISLGASGSSADCVLIWPGVNPKIMFREFFMVQNRQRVGNDAELPGEGLVIWHVDARLKNGDFACDNSTTEHKLLRLMEADGLEQIETGKEADGGDFYQSKMSFGAGTIPSSSSYTGRRSGVEIKDICRLGNAISASFAITKVGRATPPVEASADLEQ